MSTVGSRQAVLRSMYPTMQFYVYPFTHEYTNYVCALSKTNSQWFYQLNDSMKLLAQRFPEVTS